MGTRSNVVVMEDGKQMVRIYRQYDGYPEGMGANLLKILADGQSKIVNGYQSSKDIAPFSFNGMGCLAAYLIGELKGGKIGNVYISGLQKLTEEESYIEYEYTIYFKNNKLYFKVDNRESITYDGPLADCTVEKMEKQEDLTLK